MAMAVTARRFTVDEVLAWPEDGNRYELVEGVLLVTPAPVPVHQIVAGRLAAALTVPCRRWPDMYVASPGEILIRPDLKMQPDILVFRAPSIPGKWEEVRDHWLAVEVWSPSSVIYDRDVKRDAYLQVGVREVWLVDCQRKLIIVSQPGVPETVRQDSLSWRPPMVPEAAPIHLAEIFRGLD